MPTSTQVIWVWERLSLRKYTPSHKNVKIDKHSSFTVMPPSPTYTQQQPKAKPYSEIMMFVPRANMEDRTPEEINLPVLDDAERAQVGNDIQTSLPLHRSKPARCPLVRTSRNI